MSGVRAAVTAAVERAGVVAVIRIKDPSRLRAVVDALAEGGLTALEVTMTVPGAVQLIADLAPTMPDGFLLGAGTVTDADTVRRVVDAGARFVVCPVFRRTVILDAWEAGADIVKVFPATAMGPGYIKDVRGPLPQVKLMPTGGVTLDN